MVVSTTHGSYSGVSSGNGNEPSGLYGYALVDPRREHHVVGHEHRPVAGRFGPRRDLRHVLGPDHDQIEAQLHAIPLSPEFS